MQVYCVTIHEAITPKQLKVPPLGYRLRERHVFQSPSCEPSRSWFSRWRVPQHKTQQAAKVGGNALQTLRVMDKFDSHRWHQHPESCQCAYASTDVSSTGLEAILQVA